MLLTALIYGMSTSNYCEKLDEKKIFPWQLKKTPFRDNRFNLESFPLKII